MKEPTKTFVAETAGARQQLDSKVWHAKSYLVETGLSGLVVACCAGINCGGASATTSTQLCVRSIKCGDASRLQAAGRGTDGALLTRMVQDAGWSLVLVEPPTLTSNGLSKDHLK